MKTHSNATSTIVRFLLAALTLAFAVSSTRAEDQVPFKGRAEGAVTNVSPGPAGVTLTILAEGNATGLGRFTREETVLLNPATGTLTGQIVFTAANVDQLVTTVQGGFVSPTSATGTYTFTGGTGRFAHATGSADFVVSTPDGIHATIEFEGTLSSTGSNKP